MMVRHGGSAVSGRRLRRLFLAVTSTVTVLTLTSGCGLLGGSDSSNQGSADSKVEKSKIKIAIIPSTDVGPLWVAKKNGYFTAEGLDVEIVNKPSGPDVVSAVIGGDADFGFATYPVMVQAQLKGKGQTNLKIVADASAAKPDTTAVVVRKDSPLKSAADLQGKKIAVTARGTMADMGVMAGMRAAKADYSTIDWKQIGFADMLPKLQSGEIDAAFFAEPFVTIAQAQAGVSTVFQPMTGPLDGIALGGYMASEEKTTKVHPKTVAAFQRAIKKAQEEAATPAGENAVKQALVDNANVKPDIAPVLHLPSYPVTTDPTRLQRVPDLLLEFNVIPQRFDIKPMILTN
ncbi:ABC transporter substrate-binding protein [Solihabitans fulvus]|nr:ABC transporter substrate-binding protein [Solihabitans fulvus]